MTDREIRLRKLLLNEDVLNEKDAMTGDYRFSASKEMSDKKAEMTKYEKNDSTEQRDKEKKDRDKIENILKNNGNSDTSLNDIDQLRAETVITPDDETAEVPEKHKRVKILVRIC